MQVAGIILAAGRSQRMGRSKALLPLSGRSFLATLVGLARGAGLRPVRVVVAADDPGVAAAHPELVELLVENDRQDLGQLHSLRLGLGAVGAAPDAAVVFLVDHPLVAPETVHALIEAHRARGAAIVIPVHGGRRGHPVLFARAVFAELLDGPLEGGARRVVRADATRVEELEVGDAGILGDVDTPGDYRALVGDERTG